MARLGMAVAACFVTTPVPSIGRREREDCDDGLLGPGTLDCPHLELAERVYTVHRVEFDALLEGGALVLHCPQEVVCPRIVDCAGIECHPVLQRSRGSVRRRLVGALAIGPTLAREA